MNIGVDARFRASFRDWAVEWSGEWERGRLRAEAGLGSGDVPTMLIPKPRVEKHYYSKICSEELIHLRTTFQPQREETLTRQRDKGTR